LPLQLDRGTIGLVIPHRPNHCSICGRALNVHQAVRGGTCDAQECVAAAMRRTVVKRHADQLAAMEAVATQWLNDLPARTQLKDIAIVALQGYEPALEAVPTTQLEALRAHIREMISAAVAIGSERERVDLRVADDARSAALTTQPDAALVAACTACSGFCCRSGGSRAYIDGHTIDRVRSQRPDLSDADVVAVYVDAIPQQHVAKSCVFHGSEGCALPRDLRSQTCNEFYCRPVVNWWATRQSGALAVAVVYDSRVIRSTLVNCVAIP